jgi:hypothetical protein
VKISAAVPDKGPQRGNLRKSQSGDGEGGWDLPTETATEASNRNGAAMRVVENHPRKSAA